MNTLVIVLIAIVVLGAGYVLYGRHIAKSWGIDPKAETPAVKYNDGKDFVPTAGRCSAINFPLSQVQARLPAPFRRRSLVGCRCCCGS